MSKIGNKTAKRLSELEAELKHYNCKEVLGESLIELEYIHHMLSELMILDCMERKECHELIVNTARVKGKYAKEMNRGRIL